MYYDIRKKLITLDKYNDLLNLAIRKERILKKIKMRQEKFYIDYQNLVHKNFINLEIANNDKVRKINIFFDNVQKLLF